MLNIILSYNGQSYVELAEYIFGSEGNLIY